MCKIKILVLLLLITVQTISLSGCGTVISLTEAKEETTCGSDCNVPYVYSGTAVDLCGLTADNIGFFALIDLPFSVVADTLMLPYTIYRQNKLGNISVKDSCESISEINK